MTFEDDQRLRGGETQLQQRHQALAAGEYLRLATAVPQQGYRFVDRARRLVAEPRRIHPASWSVLAWRGSLGRPRPRVGGGGLGGARPLGCWRGGARRGGFRLRGGLRLCGGCRLRGGSPGGGGV